MMDSLYTRGIHEIYIRTRQTHIFPSSRAICRYIATKYASQGTTLIPTDPKELAIFEQGISVELSNFDAIASPLYHEKVLRPM